MLAAFEEGALSLSRPRDGSALAMSRRAGSKANSSKDRLNYNGYLLSYYTHYLGALLLWFVTPQF